MLRSKDNAKYLYYLFSTKQAECALNRLSNATTQAKFNKTQIRKMKIISPPDNVQSKIVKNFDEKCAVIESTMENIQAEIKILEEYKESVIFEKICHEFLLQASCFEDKELHKKYNFLNYLISYIKINHPGGGYDLEGKIRATGFIQKKTGEYKKPQMKSDPVMKLPTAYDIVLTPAKEERLSQIIIEINNRTGRNYDNDVAIKAALQIRDIMKKSEELKTSAKNNTEQDFEFAFFDHVDDALIDGLEQNQDFFTLLLQNDEIKKEVLGLFVEDTYQSLRAVNA